MRNPVKSVKVGQSRSTRPTSSPVERKSVAPPLYRGALDRLTSTAGNAALRAPEPLRDRDRLRRDRRGPSGTLVALRRRLAADLGPDAWVELLLVVLTRADRLPKARRFASFAREVLRRGATRTAGHWVGSVATLLEASGRGDVAFLARVAVDVIELRSVRPGYRKHSPLTPAFAAALRRRIDEINPPARPGRKTR